MVKLCKTGNLETYRTHEIFLILPDPFSTINLEHFKCSITHIVNQITSLGSCAGETVTLGGTIQTGKFYPCRSNTYQGNQDRGAPIPVFRLKILDNTQLFISSIAVLPYKKW